MNPFGQLRDQRPSFMLYVLTLLALLLVQGQSRDARAQSQWTTNGNNINNTNTGNVGIGTATPSAELHIAAPATGFDPQVKLEGTVDPGYGATRLTLLNPRSQLTFNAYGSGSPGILANAVGLYASAPSSALIIGSGNMPIHMFTSDSYGTPHLTLDTHGNVGIGTTAPASKLTVYDAGNSVAGQRIEIGQSPSFNYTVGRNPNTGFLEFIGTNAASSQYIGYNFNGGVRVAGNVNATGLCIAGDCKTAWSQIGGGTPSQWTTSGANIYYNAADGRVGIGTTTPAEKLDVVGNINVSGNINAKYQDVAEWVPSTQRLSAGTVVVLDESRTNYVVASANAYDTRVAGVVSARPGLLLGEGGEGRLMVATTGRVRVRVDATHAPIRVGDLLVTSDREGLAMRSDPVEVGGRRMHLPGTLIGKALEPLAGGVGEILVLLSLQ